MFETLLEMPLAVRLFIVFVVVVGLISLAAYVIYRAVRSRQPQRHQTLPLQVHGYSHGSALVFKILFSIHQSLPWSAIRTHWSRLTIGRRNLRSHRGNCVTSRMDWGHACIGAWPH